MRHRAGGVVLDFVEPAGDPPEGGDADRQDRERGQRIGVEPRREQRPTAGCHLLGVCVHEVDERGRGERGQPDPRGQAGPEAWRAPLVSVADGGQQPLTRVGGRPGPGQPDKQGGARERRYDLQRDEQEWVVARTGRGERLDVEEPIDMRRQAASGDLGDDDEERERCQPTPGKEPRMHRHFDHTPWTPPENPPGRARILLQSLEMGDDSLSPLREPPVRGVESRNGAVIVSLGGELDLYNAEEIRTALGEAIASGPSRVVIDLAEVEFVDSTALGVLIEARSRLGQESFRLAAPQLETRRALQVSGLDRHLPVHDTVDDALAD